MASTGFESQRAFSVLKPLAEAIHLSAQHLVTEHLLWAKPGGCDRTKQTPPEARGVHAGCSVGDAGDRVSSPGWGRSPGVESGNPLQYLLPGEFRGQDLVGYSPWVHKESDTTEHTHSLALLSICLSPWNVSPVRAGTGSNSFHSHIPAAS